MTTAQMPSGFHLQPCHNTRQVFQLSVCAFPMKMHRPHTVHAAAQLLKVSPAAHALQGVYVASAVTDTSRHALSTLQKFSLSSSHAPYARSCSARAATCAVYTVVHTPQVFSIAKTGPNNFVACSWPSTAQPTGCSHIGTRQTSPMRSVVQR